MLIGGAAGNVGTPAVQLAVLAGARVVASARPKDAERCRAAGASVVVDYRDEHLAGHISEAAPDGVDVVWETSGHHDWSLVERIAAPGARVLMTAAADPSAEVPWGGLYTRDVQVLGFVISRASSAELAEAAALVNHLLAEGVLTARVADVLPLSQTAEVHRRLEDGEVSGRLLLRP